MVIWGFLIGVGERWELDGCCLRLGSVKDGVGGGGGQRMMRLERRRRRTVKGMDIA